MPVICTGSYFYYRASSEPPSDIHLLVFPTQKHILNISFAYFITSSLELLLVQENVKHVEIESNHTGNENQTATSVWEQTSYTLDPPSPIGGGIILRVRTLFDLGEGAVDPVSSALVLAVDDILMTFDLPCDYDMLSNTGQCTLYYYNQYTVHYYNPCQCTL